LTLKQKLKILFTDTVPLYFTQDGSDTTWHRMLLGW